MFAFETSRRALLGGAAAGGALALFPAALRAATTANGDPQLTAALKAIFDAMLQRAPEQATLLGADRGANAQLAFRLSDLSAAGQAADRAVEAQALKTLRGINRDRLTGADINFYDSALFSFEVAEAGTKFPFGFTGPSGGVPYVVSQQNGTYSQAGEFLDAYHRVEDAEGADAYMSRLAQVGPAMDEETRRIREDAGRGVVPPDFIVSNTLGQQAELRKLPAAQSKFVTSLAARTKKLGLPDRSAAATKIVETQIYPALDRQMAALKALKTNSEAGVWKLPNGGEYYRWLLKSQTTSNQTAEEIHRTGLEQNKAIDAEMDKILRAQGLTKGTVGERAAALTADPRFLKPDSDAGRAAVIAYIQGQIDAIRPRMPELSRMNLKAPVTVKRVPVDIQDGASLGYMNPAAPDGSRPAIYYINLKNMDYWPTWTLPSLSFHEAIPGHAWHFAYLAENPGAVSPLAQLINYNAFTEGWALYAEQIVDEIGYYKDDPYGRLGYLNAQRFRAVRLIVDTGMHEKRWTRDKAIEVMVAETGRSKGAVTSEIDRYCASPGQACGYKVGHNEILKQRERAKQMLGPKYDIRDFNDALVQSGGVPMTALPGVVDRMAAKVKAG
jgi:uncharacterized protein (DUF885 family)